MNAKKSEDGKSLVLQVVNPDGQPCPSQVEIRGFAPSRPVATIEQMAGPLEARNTAQETERIRPVRSEWKHGLESGKASYTFPPHSITILRLE